MENVRATFDGERVRTKTELKLAAKNHPGGLKFFSTSAFNIGSVWYGDELTTEDHLIVVGPDPYTDRRWYANITYRNGKLVVS